MPYGNLTDVRVPCYVPGQTVRAGAPLPAMTSHIDPGTTLLQLASAQAHAPMG